MGARGNDFCASDKLAAFRLSRHVSRDITGIHVKSEVEQQAFINCIPGHTDH